MCPVNNESFAFTDMITVFGQASSRLLQYIYIMVSMLVVLSCSEGKKEKIVTPWGEVGEDSVPKNLNFTVDDIISNGELIILTLSGPETYYDYRGRGMGTQYLLCEKFAEKLGVSLRVEVCKDTAEMVSRLENGDADLIAVPLPKKQNTGKGLLFCGAGVDSLGIQWAVADGKTSFAEARREFEEIVRVRPANPWMVWLLASLANMSFCRLFGGDFAAMLIVLCGTLAGYKLKQVMLEDGRDVRFTFFCCAFFSSVIGAAGYVFHWGDTPEIALATSVLYLIPGIPYINSVSDLLDGHYICSFSRFMNAAVLTACLSAGLCGGLLLMNIQWL